MPIACSLYPWWLANWLFLSGSTNFNPSPAISFHKMYGNLLSLRTVYLSEVWNAQWSHRFRKGRPCTTVPCDLPSSLPWENRSKVTVPLSHLRKKKESQSLSKIIKLSELLDLGKITQGNRMSFNFVVLFVGEPFAGGYMSVT